MGTIEIWSHPGVLLEDHLKQVASEAKSLLDHPSLQNRNLLREVAFLVGVAHDFGKFTSYFQRHLKGENIRSGLHHHSLLSALFASFLSQKIFPDYPETWLIAYIAVHRHHGNLCIPDQILKTEDKDKLLKQWKDLVQRKAIVQKTLQKIWERGDAGFLDLSFDCLVEEVIKKVKASYRNIYRSIPDCEEDPEKIHAQQAKIALQTQLVYSALISADKFAAAGLKRPKRIELPIKMVDSYLKDVSDSPLARLRRSMQDSVCKNLKQAVLPGIFTLTAPTGSGKTLASLRAALTIREKLKNNYKSVPRIIYALPFINLIEQTENVFQNVLEQIEEYKKSPENILISHHHLAEIKYRDESEELPVQNALLMVETWESEIIITTFVQIFHTLFGYKNRWLKKMHNIIGAILILDEPQQFPFEYWKAIGWMIELLNQEMGVTVILMTATQPKILEGISHKELVDLNVRKSFQSYKNRYEVEDILESEEFYDKLQDEMSWSKSILIVVNTIKTSLELWDYFAKQNVDNLFYLSTNIIPLDRKEKIKQIKEKLDRSEPVITVATQVVEAGVDLDFDVVFREISPLDTLIQAAGRCNREAKKSIGKVYRFCLKESIRRGGMVYGRVAMELSREIWSKKKIAEMELLSLLNDFFQAILKRKSQISSFCLWEKYARLFFSDSRGFVETLKDYPLLSPKQELSVLVMTSRQDEERLEEIDKLVFQEKDFLKRKEAYLQNRRWLHERTLNLLVERVIYNLPPCWNNMDLRWIPFSQLRDFYHPDTGFKWRENDLEGEVWIL